MGTGRFFCVGRVHNEEGEMFLEKFTEGVFAIVGILLILLIVFFLTVFGVFTYYKLNECECVKEEMVCNEMTEVEK